MNFRFVIILILFSLATNGCKKKLIENESDYRTGITEVTSKDFLIPRTLRERIEKDYLALVHKENPKIILPDVEILNKIPREFLLVDIYFSPLGQGILSEPTVFRLPRGGGVIDLKDYVTGKKGSFYLKYKVARSDKPDEPLQALHIYFFSEAKERIIEGEKFGAGCNKYMEVTSLLADINSSKGLRLNATAQRYLSVLGGVFYFVGLDPNRKIYLSAIRFTDSRYPDLLCSDEK